MATAAAVYSSRQLVKRRSLRNAMSGLLNARSSRVSVRSSRLSNSPPAGIASALNSPRPGAPDGKLVSTTVEHSPGAHDLASSISKSPDIEERKAEVHRRGSVYVGDKELMKEIEQRLT